MEWKPCFVGKGGSVSSADSSDSSELKVGLQVGKTFGRVGNGFILTGIGYE